MYNFGAFMTPSPPSFLERRKLPDPTTPRLLFTWILFLPVFWWLAQRFFQKRLFFYDGQSWRITPLGSLCVLFSTAAWAAFLAAVFYKFKFGKFHVVSILRVVRGILSLFLITLVFCWPISMMIIALNPEHTLYFVLTCALGVLLLCLVIRLAGAPERGFWQDWVNDTLLRW